MANNTNLTAAQEVILAAVDLASQGKEQFSEWDLTIAVWQKNKNRFGCRGYEDRYPDHKRVMMEIMGKTKKDNPLRRGWMEKTSPNHYRITPLGLAEAEHLVHFKGNVKVSGRSAQTTYNAVLPYIEHRVFRDYCRDPAEPRMWLGAASFLGLTKNDALHLKDRIRALEDAIKLTITWMTDTGEDNIRRGVTGGGVTIRRTDVESLAQFVEIIKSRFKVQIDAIFQAASKEF